MLRPPTTLLFLLLSVCGISAMRWTEQDEARRISQLKEQERIEFQMEMQQQENVGGGGGYAGDYFSGSSVSARYRPSSGGAIDRSNGQQGQFSSYSAQRSSQNPRHYAALSLPSQNFCYHCASPFGTVSPDLQKAIQMFLKMRRTKYPSEVVTSQCSNPKNIGALAKQTCLHGYCETLVLTDHDTGSAFTIRGCAEHFGAIDEALFEENGDNQCSRLHDQLDIQECICKHRKYCYSGPDRRIYEEFNAAPNTPPPPRSTNTRKVAKRLL
ncbi:hypothetical protein L596_014459 [Steinernema carpocapsae]|uniref:DUF19 domain-containing protein n=1 Tax=Steinernema carpocapsae TaxID=34508 RepID=A0A4U5NC02_STECR|nr:hypothetical protein L596_014459 [Steinernema carpocapsae]